MSAKELLQDAVEAVENAKESAKNLIETLGNRILELLGNDDTEELEALANELIADAEELSGFVTANTPAEAPTDPVVPVEGEEGNQPG